MRVTGLGRVGVMDIVFTSGILMDLRGLCDDVHGMLFDAAQGLYWYCANNHTGQWSVLYRLMCALDYHPSASESGPNTEIADAVYAALLVSNQPTCDAQRIAGDIEAWFEATAY